MKYIRTKDGRIIKIGEGTDAGYDLGTLEVHNKAGIVASYEPIEVLKEANTIEELIQIGDIVFYWLPSDDKEHCILINYESEIVSMKYNAITKLLIPVTDDYKCVAKGYPSFNLIKNRRYLVKKGELELL